MLPYREAGLEALQRFGIRAGKMTVDEAADSFCQLSTQARRMVSHFLIQIVESNDWRTSPVANAQWWNQLAAMEEQKTLGTTLLQTLIDADIEKLVDLVESEKYRELEPELLVVSASILAHEERPQMAEKLFRFALKRDPDSFEINHDFAQFLLEQNPPRPLEALEFCSAAWTMRRNEHSMFQMAECLIRCKMYDRSIELIESHSNECLTNVNRLRYNVSQLLDLGQLDHAEEVFSIMRTKKADPCLLHMVAGRIALAKYRYATAEREFAMARSLAITDPKRFAEISFEEGQMGCMSDACSRMEEYYEKYPNEHAVVYSLAQLKQKLEQYAEAEALYRKCIEIQPADARPFCNLGYCVTQLNRREEAVRFYEQGHRIGTRRGNWHYDSATWIEIAKRKLADGNEIDLQIQNQMSVRELANFYPLITDLLRPMERFESAYQLCKVIPDEIRDPKIWLTAASVAADHLAQDLDSTTELTEVEREEVVSQMLDWFERSVSLVEESPLSNGLIYEYYLLAMRDALQTESYATLRGYATGDQLPEEAAEKLRSFWLRIESRAQSMLEEMG
jgi:tetratricopeptide (TPR) repeat protein